MNLINIGNIMRFISRSPVDVCNYSVISHNTGITKYKVQEYIGLLEQAFLLKVMLPYGSNVTREPKILYRLPFRSYFSEGTEDDRFVLSQPGNLEKGIPLILFGFL